MTPEDLVNYYVGLLWRGGMMSYKVSRTARYDEPAMAICNLQEVCRKRGLL